MVFSVREPGQMKVQNRLIQLIGEKPILKCSLNDVECEALWDTGSKVSLINFDWFEERFPTKPTQSVYEFLEGDNLHLCAANSTNVEVEGGGGVAILEFSIEKNFNVPVSFLTLLVPGYLGCIEAPGVAPEATPTEMPFLFRYKP